MRFLSPVISWWRSGIEPHTSDMLSHQQASRSPQSAYLACRVRTGITADAAKRAGDEIGAAS
jgi:hypothetical protein